METCIANNNNVKSKYCLDYHPTPQAGGKGVNINGDMHSTMSLTEQPRGALQKNEPTNY